MTDANVEIVYSSYRRDLPTAGEQYYCPKRKDYRLYKPRIETLRDNAGGSPKLRSIRDRIREFQAKNSRSRDFMKFHDFHDFRSHGWTLIGPKLIYTNLWEAERLHGPNYIY